MHPHISIILSAYTIKRKVLSNMLERGWTLCDTPTWQGTDKGVIRPDKELSPKYMHMATHKQYPLPFPISSARDRHHKQHKERTRSPHRHYQNRVMRPFITSGSSETTVMMHERKGEYAGGKCWKETAMCTCKYIGSRFLPQVCFVLWLYKHMVAPFPISDLSRTPIIKLSSRKRKMKWLNDTKLA